jgi:hypothetical protein
MTLLRPEVVILRGRAMKKFYKYTADIIESDLRRSHDFIGNCRIIVSEAAAETALVGAAELIFRQKNCS